MEIFKGELNINDANIALFNNIDTNIMQNCNTSCENI